jgi:cytochrome c-type biogenesis protein CcmH
MTTSTAEQQDHAGGPVAGRDGGGRRSRTALNRRLKGWPGWLLLLLVAASLLTVGATRTAGPQTPEERVEAITRRIACPICDGESVFESRNNASRDIRNRVTELVRANDLSDDEIVGFIETRYGASVLLVPKASGFDALVWFLPALFAVAGIVGLVVVFRRWRLQAAGAGTATDADRALVEAALREQAELDDELRRPSEPDR